MVGTRHGNRTMVLGGGVFMGYWGAEPPMVPAIMKFGIPRSPRFWTLLISDSGQWGIRDKDYASILHPLLSSQPIIASAERNQDCFCWEGVEVGLEIIILGLI